MNDDYNKSKLLSFRDLPFSRTTAWRLIRQRKLQCYRVNRRVFFDARHVDEFLRSCETPIALSAAATMRKPKRG